LPFRWLLQSEGFPDEFPLDADSVLANLQKMCWADKKSSPRASSGSNAIGDYFINVGRRKSLSRFLEEPTAGACRKLLSAFIALLFSASALCAQPTKPAAPSSPALLLRVLVRNVEPFAVEKDGRRAGFAIDLWTEVARECGFQFEMQTTNSAQAMVDALAAKKADVGLGAFSVTSQREQIIDFSYPFYHSGLDIVTTAKQASIFKMIGTLFNLRLLKILGLLLALVLGVSHLLWWFERRFDNEDFPPSYKAGLGESLWWVVSVMITLGCENKSPKGLITRTVAAIWMAGGVLMVSLMTASFSSSLTVNTLSGAINGPADLAGHTVATVTNSTADIWLTRQGRIDVQRHHASAEEAIGAVSKGEADAAVYDEPILRYHLTKNPDKKLHLVGSLFEKQNYGIGLQLKSPHVKKINQALLKLSEDKALEKLNKKWFGQAFSQK
jgi:polar amino acid transport system substrate-binding protein